MHLRYVDGVPTDFDFPSKSSCLKLIPILLFWLIGQVMVLVQEKPGSLALTAIRGNMDDEMAI
jgi:hypothetical protein